MAWFFRKEQGADKSDKQEQRAETPNKPEQEVALDEPLLRAMLGVPGTLTKIEALKIPTVQGCINFVANAVASLPIKLYREGDGEAEEVKGDNRVRILNDDTGDTLDAVQFWRAIITDYYLGKGGYAYIHRENGAISSLHYVDESAISINSSHDPIFKDYDLIVNGLVYKPFEFIKILRNTKNGASGNSIVSDNPLVLSVAYNALVFEENLVKKGGNKKGFIKAMKKLSKDAMDELKSAWRKMYSNESENVIILNDGLDFKEASNTLVEMQLKENKEVNSIEIRKLFNLTANEFIDSFKAGVMPVLRTIECALNRDFLLEREKESFYFAFDTKEILKGDIKTRYEAYKIAIDANFLKIDEVRYMEDLPSLGLDWIKIGLDSVLYDPITKVIYTPNTGMSSTMLQEESLGRE